VVILAWRWDLLAHLARADNFVHTSNITIIEFFYLFVHPLVPAMPRKINRIPRKPDTIPRPPVSHDIDAQLDGLSKEWEVSQQKEHLEQQVQTLLSEDSIVVDSALCLGMGSLERADLRPLPSCTLDPDSWDSVSFCPVASGRQRNGGLYQLLVFETVLTCLREKFIIDTVRFQDPAFTPKDREFLSRRGHTVLDWDGPVPEHGKDLPLNPQLHNLISSSTLCYLPHLPLAVVVDVVCRAKPSLYLGDDLVSTTVHRFSPDHVSEDAMHIFSSIALSSHFATVVAFGTDFGFMWPADLTCEETKKEVEERNSRVLKSELDRWEAIDQMMQRRL
jgi:hypothetical protein